MTNREFVHAKFGLFLLTGMTVFFTSINLLLMVLEIFHPTIDAIPSLADWILKGAIGPLVGALINSIITPHGSGRREDSAEFVARDAPIVSQETHTETVTVKEQPPKGE